MGQEMRPEIRPAPGAAATTWYEYRAAHYGPGTVLLTEAWLATDSELYGL